MTVKDLLEHLHCSTKENISYRFYVYETKQEFKFKNYENLLNLTQYETDLLEREIYYFSFTCDSFAFTLSARLVNNEK